MFHITGTNSASEQWHCKLNVYTVDAKTPAYCTKISLQNIQVSSLRSTQLVPFHNTLLDLLHCNEENNEHKQVEI